MNKWVIFGASLLARAISVVCDSYSEWLLGKLAEGQIVVADVAHDAMAFCEWLVEVLANRWTEYAPTFRLR